MDYKKKYKDALERAKYALTTDMNESGHWAVKHIFPELKESEDERIKETLIDYFKIYKKQEECGIKTFFGIPTDNIIAWLEKQDEQNPIMNVPTREVILSIWDLGNEWKELTNGSISTKYGTQLDYIQKHWNESEYYLREKQGEKKVPSVDFNAKDWYVSKVDGKIHDMTYNPADKVEPKFKVGDWIVNNEDGSIGQITDIIYDESGYGYNHTNGWLHSVFEKDFHLWTVQDAKDGDVLVYGDNPNDHHVKVIMIFKSWRNSESAFTYFHVYDNEVRVNDWCDCGKNAHPATKEQRDILFTKMKKAGYELDVEKKAIIPISKSKVVEYVYILDYCSGRVIIAKHDTEESIETLFDRLGLKESQCQYMVSSDILSIEYINF